MALSNDDLDRLKSWTTIASSVAIPIVLAVVGYLLNQNIATEGLKKDYVQIAVTILKESAASQEPDLRNWAVQVLDQNAPIPFGPKAKDSLFQGSSWRSFYKSAPQVCITDIKMPRGAEIASAFSHKHRMNGGVAPSKKDIDQLVDDLFAEGAVGEENTMKLNCVVSWMKDLDRMREDPLFAAEMREKAAAIRAQSATSAASR